MKKSEYIPSLTLQEGIRILIEDQDMPLYPFEKALSIAPGMSASISIKKVTDQTSLKYIFICLIGENRDDGAQLCCKLNGCCLCMRVFYN